MGGQGRYERRSEVFVKIHFHFFRWEGSGRGGGVRLRGWGVRLDLNGEFKFF